MAVHKAKKAKVEERGPAVDVVIGVQWGDEGKGKFVDVLAQQMSLTCRCAGGNNAGHTVIAHGVNYDFHLLPSGIVNPKGRALIGNGVVIHLPSLLSEIAKNEAKGLSNIKERLLISDRAHLVFDFHQEIDGIEEEEKAKTSASVGTTRKGIGPTYASKSSRIGLRVCDLVGKFADFEKGFRSLVAQLKARYPTLSVDVDAQLAQYKSLAETIRPMVVDGVEFIHRAMGDPAETILIEGANGVMLDLDFGTYPFVTSSSASIGGMITGLGVPPQAINQVYGILKAYTTRVGGGDFPTEDKGVIGDKLQTIGREIGVTTGRRRRCGWLDLVVARYTTAICGVTQLCLTKIDVLDSFETIDVAVAYDHHGKILTSYPANAAITPELKPVYKTFKGWMTPLSKCRNFEDLPAEAQEFICFIEEFLSIPVTWISVGPARDETIIVERA